jgi:CRISPR type III-A-associated protein Csm2
MNDKQKNYPQKGSKPEPVSFIPTLNGFKESILTFSTANNLSDLINAIKGLAEHDCKELKAHQLRRLYDEVRKKSEPNEIQLLRAKFAYAMARQTSNRSKAVIAFFDTIMEKVSTKEHVSEFKMFFEAVVAYHKFHHGNK